MFNYFCSFQEKKRTDSSAVKNIFDPENEEKNHHKLGSYYFTVTKKDFLKGS